MIHRPRPSSTVTLLVAVFLVLSSLLPFWAGSQAGAAGTTDVAHAAMHHSGSDHSGSPAPSSSDTCPSHDSCSGQCCAGCAMCVSTLPDVRVLLPVSSPDLRAAVPGFRSGGSVSFLERPPRG